MWVTDLEIKQMAERLGLLCDEFVRAYVRTVGLRRSLRELPGGDCVLWGGKERGCLVHAVRPIQCRTFPFWHEHLRSQRSWENLARSCPGVNKGKLHTLKRIEGLLKRKL